MARSSNTQKLTDLEALNCQVDQLEKELEALKTKAEESLEVNDFETRVKNLEDFAQEFKQVSLGKDSEKSSPQKFRASFRGFQRKLRGSFKDFVKTQMDPDHWPVTNRPQRPQRSVDFKVNWPNSQVFCMSKFVTIIEVLVFCIFCKRSTYNTFESKLHCNNFPHCSWRNKTKNPLKNFPCCYVDYFRNSLLPGFLSVFSILTFFQFHCNNFPLWKENCSRLCKIEIPRYLLQNQNLLRANLSSTHHI